jgi:hypothetical protein
MSQLHSNLLAGKYPLVVTEGTRSDKEARIARSPYLTNCHQKLRGLGGDLFLYGISMGTNDAHVFDAISDPSSDVRRLYVGLHGHSSESRDELELRAMALRRARKRNGGRSLGVRFFQSETARVWR